jgi:hypothetical protein
MRLDRATADCEGMVAVRALKTATGRFTVGELIEAGLVAKTVAGFKLLVGLRANAHLPPVIPITPIQGFPKCYGRSPQ